MDLKIRVMKIKGLLFGLFACAALAACTNDDIVENKGIRRSLWVLTRVIAL